MLKESDNTQSMRVYIIIPAHNEEETIGRTLESIIKQTVLPKKVIVVNDNSSDQTAKIISKYISKHDWISSIDNESTDAHMPGSKVINAFYKGYSLISKDYDIICKFDADIILPIDYIEKIVKLFKNDSKIGIAGGLAYIKKNDSWVYENISNQSHVRGPFKAYRKECFHEIGGLKASIGWDTVDTLLAHFFGWKTVTDKSMHVKHLKPTGISYSKTSKFLQGEAMYKMRYGFAITLISALKLAFKKRSLRLLKDYISGYFKAQKNNVDYLVTEEQGKFIRRLRWKGILKKLS